MAGSPANLLSLDLVRSIDPHCDAFDQSWAQNQRPRIEDFLPQVSEIVQPLLLSELIRSELEWRFRHGETPMPGDYLSRFPQLAGDIASWISEARQASDAYQNTANQALSGTVDYSSNTPSPPSIATLSAPAMAMEAATAPVLRQLGEYDLLELLGEGGMGAVYRGLHRKLDRPVAIKLLRSGSETSRDRVSRFLREMRALAPLEHKNLIEAQDAGEVNGELYLVMKLITGATLTDYVKDRQPLSIGEACDLARQVAEGLDYLAGKGLVHRDIKPSNLMRTPEGVVKILDLGLARWQREGESEIKDDLTSPGQTLGTPDYLAPEQIEAAAEVDIRADLYALGATLFFLLTGKAPFVQRKTLREKLNAHLTEKAPDVRQLRPEVPAELARLIARLLEKEPANRPQKPSEVVAALTPYVGDSSTVTITAPRPRFPMGILVGAGALAATVLGIILYSLIGPSRLSERDKVTSVTPGTETKIVTQLEVRGLRVKKLEVRHFDKGNPVGDVDRGILGDQSFVTWLGDGVTVEAELNQPAYAFLIAFRPDGTEELCFPENENEAPPLTDRPRYPLLDRSVRYGLEEGTGLQVFALVASKEPLPCYKDWKAQRGAFPWEKQAISGGIVWYDDGQIAEEYTERNPISRGKGQKAKGKDPVVKMTDWLRKGPGELISAGVGFAVEERKKP